MITRSPRSGIMDHVGHILLRVGAGATRIDIPEDLQPEPEGRSIMTHTDPEASMSFRGVAGDMSLTTNVITALLQTNGGISLPFARYVCDWLALKAAQSAGRSPVFNTF